MNGRATFGSVERKEEVCPAKEWSSVDRKRSLRDLGFGGEGSVRVGEGVVTSCSKDTASRMKRIPPVPNQALQPTRMLVTCRADARPAPSTRVADL